MGWLAERREPFWAGGSALETTLCGPRFGRPEGVRSALFLNRPQGCVKVFLEQHDLSLQADDFPNHTFGEQLELAHRLDLLRVPGGDLLREPADMAIKVSVHAAHEGPDGGRDSIPTELEQSLHRLTPT